MSEQPTESEMYGTPGRFIGRKLVKGVDTLLTPEDIAQIIQRPVRWVREKLIEPGILKTVSFGGNSKRVRPRDWEAFLEKGQTGYRHAAPSGRRQACAR